MALYRTVLERIRGLPGVRTVAWAGDAPLTRIHIAETFVPAEQSTTEKRDWIEIESNVITPLYFEVLGIPLLRGRDFSDQDQETAPGVVIVNETMARRYWPGVDPVGKRIRVRGRARETFEVVGVAKDAKYRTLSEDSKPYAYFSLYQRYYSSSTLHVKIAGDPGAMLPFVRREVEAVNADLMVSDARALSEQIAVSLSPQRVAATMLGIPGLLALILATVGVYGVMAYFVAQRTQEIGIRLALGARHKDILSLTFKEGMSLVLIGLGIGVPFALVLSRFLASWIHGVGPTDTVTYLGVSLLFIGTSSLAIYVPARRASKVDPIVALRNQ
jgi:predicted permease